VTEPTRLAPAQLAAYFALTEVSSLLEHAVEQQLKTDGGLTTPQFQILARLNAAGGTLRMTDLADGLVYSRSGLTYQAAQLEKRGLVTRTPGADDERSVEVTLTPAGAGVLGQVMGGHIEVVQRLMMTGLTDDDIATLNEVLTRLRDHMRSAPPRSAAPRAAKRQA